MSDDELSWKDLRRRIPTDQLPRNTTTYASMRVLAANDNGHASKQIRVMFKPPTESAFQSAAEVFLQLLDRAPVTNDN